MKKTIITIVALTVLLVSACPYAFAEEAGLPAETGIVLPEEGWVAESIDGTVWIDDRASLEVFPGEDGIKVLILWGSSAWELTEWTYTCAYDAETQALKATRAVCDNVLYDDDGNAARTNVFDQESEAVFMLDGEGRPIGAEGEDELVPADTTIIAINQRPKDKLVNTTHGLKASERGLLIVDENSMTTREGVFAAGDVVHGSLTVVHAVRDARLAAEAMMRFMEK